MANKDKKQKEDLILGYFAKELTEEQEGELLEWLNADPSHKETFSKMADWWATAHIPLFMTNMQSDLDRFFDRQDQRNHPGNKSRMFNLTFFRNIAAAILVLVVVGGISYYIGQQDSQDRLTEFMTSQQITSEVATPMGATSKVLLPDGSLAWLNAGTCLTYTYNYGEGVREVHLEGEAYFDVVPDKDHPFIVKSNNLGIKVLGTSFNVKSYADDSQIKVALVTGSVNVKVDQPEKETMDFTLSPDRMLTFDKESNIVEIAEFRGKDAMAWTTGGLKFNSMPFAHIAKDLERKFDMRIRIESERLRKEVFTGSFSADYSLKQILDEVDMEKRYRWTYERGEVIIRDK